MGIPGLALDRARASGKPQGRIRRRWHTQGLPVSAHRRLARPECSPGALDCERTGLGSSRARRKIKRPDPGRHPASHRRRHLGTRDQLAGDIERRRVEPWRSVAGGARQTEFSHQDRRRTGKRRPARPSPAGRTGRHPERAGGARQCRHRPARPESDDQSLAVDRRRYPTQCRRIADATLGSALDAGRTTTEIAASQPRRQYRQYRHPERIA